jgi:hypothetical protein
MDRRSKWPVYSGQSPKDDLEGDGGRVHDDAIPGVLELSRLAEADEGEHMPIEFRVDHPCPIYQQQGAERLALLLRSRHQAQVMTAAMQATGATDPMQVKLKRTFSTPGGPVEQEVNLLQLMMEGQELDAASFNCNDCPARGKPEPFSCWGTIDYPIQATTEQWLLSRLPQKISCTAGTYLRHTFQNGYDGQVVNQRRLGKVKQFELPAPLLQMFTDALDGFMLSTDQLLHTTFFGDEISPVHAVMLALFYGCIPHEVSEDDFVLSGGDPAMVGFLFQLVPDLGDNSPQVAACLDFLSLLRPSATLQVPIKIQA